LDIHSQTEKSQKNTQSMEIYITPHAPTQKETLSSWLEILRDYKLETNFFSYVARKTPSQILHLLTIKIKNCNYNIH
jgi:hypothetical protein